MMRYTRADATRRHDASAIQSTCRYLVYALFYVATIRAPLSMPALLERRYAIMPRLPSLMRHYAGATIRCCSRLFTLLLTICCYAAAAASAMRCRRCLSPFFFFFAATLARHVYRDDPTDVGYDAAVALMTYEMLVTRAALLLCAQRYNAYMPRGGAQDEREHIMPARSASPCARALKSAMRRDDCVAERGATLLPRALRDLMLCYALMP